MKKIIGRVWVVSLVLVVTGAALFCVRKVQRQRQADQEQVEEGFVWVTDYLDMDVKKRQLEITRVKGDVLYYLEGQYNEQDRDGIVLSSVSLTDGSRGAGIPLEMDMPQTPNEGSEHVSRKISAFALDSAGGVVTAEYVTHYNSDVREWTYEHYCCIYDAAGKLESSVELTGLMEENGDSGIRYVDVDAADRIYLNGQNSVIYLFDAAGNEAGVIHAYEDIQVDSMGIGRDGRVYIAGTDEGNGKSVLRELDFEGKKLGAEYRNFMEPWKAGVLAAGVEKDFIGCEYAGLYEYDMKTRTQQKALDWLEHGVIPESIECLCALEDGRFAVVTFDETERHSGLAILSKIPASEAPQKIEITVASLYDDQKIQSAASDFNRRNSQYHIRLQSYFDENDVTWTPFGNNYNEVLAEAVSRLNMDIVSDNCPDILVLDGLNPSRYAAKGVFEDLNVWLDNSSQMERSDFFESVLECYTYDGVLVAIPKNFTLTTLMGSAADLGTKPGWTLREIMDYANAHPDARLMANADKEEILETLFQYTQDTFVDWRSGQCFFDGDTFVELLEFADRFPETAEKENSYPEQIGRGKILLNDVRIFNFEDVQFWEAMFDGPVNYIGYPNENGDSGTYLTESNNSMGGMAIAADSANKEAAWAFVESWLGEYSNDYLWDFPSRISEFEERKAEAVKVEYAYEHVWDEDGTMMLDADGNAVYKLDDEGNLVIAKDQNGEPIVYDLRGERQIGTWVYTTHVPTAEETDRVEELIRTAKPAVSYDMEILKIVDEEALAFFKGQKSAKEVASLIQNRVQLYVDENR